LRIVEGALWGAKGGGKLTEAGWEKGGVVKSSEVSKQGGPNLSSEIRAGIRRRVWKRKRK